jgi:hydrogenase maturation protease
MELNRYERSWSIGGSGRGDDGSGSADGWRKEQMTKLLVVGIGNPDRGDDDIGPLVVRRLGGRVSNGVSLIERTGDALALIDDWAGHDVVIVVDAAAPPSELGYVRSPGRVHRIDLRGNELLPDLSRASTHGLGVADAVELARALGALPERVIVYAVEGADFNPGAPMTKLVAAATEEVVARVVAELCQLERDAAGEATHA